MRARKQTESGVSAGKLVQTVDQILSTVLQQYATPALVLLFCIVAIVGSFVIRDLQSTCLLYTSPSPRD